jgi:hypothetical protein
MLNSGMNMREIVNLLESKHQQIEIGGHLLPLNDDKTVTLYHATNEIAAQAIIRTRVVRSAGEPSVYFSTAQAETGYGPVVVAVQLLPKTLQIDDEFPDGRVDFRIDQPTVKVKSAKIVSPLLETIQLVETFLSEGKFSQSTFFKRLQSVVTLARRGATEGERDASRIAMLRLMERAKTEALSMQQDDAMRFIAKAKEVLASLNGPEPPSSSSSTSRSRTNTQTPSQLPIGTWVCIRPSGSKQTEKFGTIAAHDNSGGSIVNVTVNNRNIRYSVWSYQLRRATQQEIDAAIARGVVKPSF